MRVRRCSATRHLHSILISTHATALPACFSDCALARCSSALYRPFRYIDRPDGPGITLIFCHVIATHAMFCAPWEGALSVPSFTTLARRPFNARTLCPLKPWRAVLGSRSPSTIHTNCPDTSVSDAMHSPALSFQSLPTFQDRGMPSRDAILQIKLSLTICRWYFQVTFLISLFAPSYMSRL